MSDKKTNTGESMLQTWSETQQNLLTDWLETLRKLGGKPALELWAQTVDTWQSAVKDTVDTRAEFTRQLIETLANAKGTPEELRELTRKEREQVQHWAEAERELWQGWFNIVRDINFRPEPGAAAQGGRDIVQLWQESAHKMIDAQASLIRRLTGGTSRTKKQE
jgi:hypothetical protein